MNRDFKMDERLARYLHKRVLELDFDGQVNDVRSDRGKRWSLTQLLCGVILGVVCGRKSLKESEDVTAEFSVQLRRLFRIHRRMPDTTMRDFLVRLRPENLRIILHTSVQRALRRKALEPSGLPCGVVAMDGKWTGTNVEDTTYAQYHSEGPNEKTRQHVRTVTSCLMSSRAKPCLDAFPIPPSTNEKGIFKKAFDELVSKYGEHFEIVTYDPGATTKANAAHVHNKGYGYFFAIKSDQPTLHQEARRLLETLSSDEAIAYVIDPPVSGKTTIRRLWRNREIAGFHDWSHLRAVYRVEAKVVDEQGGGIISVENRYFVTNVHPGRMKNEQWLDLIRRHWDVENCHNILDRILREDDRVWIREPQGMLVVQMLRRVAYNLMALFRSVTQRAEDKRAMPWRDLMNAFYLAFVRLGRSDGDRTRSASPRVFVTSC